MKRCIKKPFELDEDVINIIKGMSEHFDMTEKDIVELAILQPKIYTSSLRVYNVMKEKEDG